MSKAEYQAGDILLPIAGSVMVLAVGAVSANVDLSAWIDKYITLASDGADMYIVAGADNTVVADPSAVAGATQCWPLKDGVPQHFRVHSNAPWLAYISTGTPNLRIYLSSI